MSAAYQVRIHGRGGQGVVTAAELLSVAAFHEGRFAQAFPSFGSERTGAPVVAFCRIAGTPIRTRDPIAEPDAVIIQDPTLLHDPALLAGLRRGGVVLVNSTRDPQALVAELRSPRLAAAEVRTVPATEIALELVGKPVPNTVLLGAFAAATGVVSLAAVQHAIGERFAGRVGEANTQAAAAAFQHVRGEMEAYSGVPAD